MPCFKGLAVSIHTLDGPLPEYSIQKQSRQSRISSYIPVPAPRLNSKTGEPEQSTFAVSITLLTPGQPVPYSRPAPTVEDPDPQPKIVGGLPSLSGDRGRYGNVIGPYLPLTSSGNETVAAYIYFDGRTKEEVATLLRRSEETWVNSRWVSVPDSEGGGLGEREFLFREVGLERWLNGLDLQGPTQDEKLKIIERRKRRLERHRLKRATTVNGSENALGLSRQNSSGVLRYGEDKQTPLENLSADEDMFDSDSDDEPPTPEAAGQIKVTLFRVMASGEIKRGEYSPQFDAHDDEDGHGGEGERGSGNADIDHTTSFAKPKSLDPASISTQTVTGIDPPDKPYATFTFFYRGRSKSPCLRSPISAKSDFTTEQLQKMGILQTEPNQTPSSPDQKRKSGTVDFSSLGPLKSNAKGTVGFASYRDSANASTPRKKGKKSDDDDDDMDSDDDDDRTNGRKRATGEADDDEKIEEIERRRSSLSEEEMRRRGELAEGMKKIHLKRQLSFESKSETKTSSRSQVLDVTASETPARTSFDGGAISTPAVAAPATHPSALSPHLGEGPESSIGSPFKKQRASVSGSDDLQRSLFSKPAAPQEHPTNEPASNAHRGVDREPAPSNSAVSNGVDQKATGTEEKQPLAKVEDMDEEL